jgi:hypothetical protein
VRYEPPQQSIAPDDIPAFLLKELQKIQAVLSNLSTESINIPLRAAEPERYEEGMIVGADGSNWDPGSGSGLYQLRSGAWVKIG